MRWSDNNEEVALLGVNYCVSSASAFRMLKAVGVSVKVAIDQDLVHFRRLGLNAIRLSFWGDWENSDEKGNLVDNEHLEALDYLVHRAGAMGIYMLLSPIITYDASWPDEMDRKRTGISSAFKKEILGTDPAAIAAQVNFLGQILRHRNRYSEICYKDDPAILAVELINEPWHHPEDHDGSVRYINALDQAVRDAGCAKPTFYNVTERFAIADAVRDSNVDGATFGWYPTGLVSGHTLHGNFLPTVDDFKEMRDPRLASKAKLVYEFDAPDLLYSYMYPAMARTFRRGGVQFATMFTYDSLPIAAGNLEFQTHYLNLVFTPGKAISLMIAAEVFRRIPRGKDYGAFPTNKTFAEFRVDDIEDVSELVAQDKFLYSNHTVSAPSNPSTLRHIAGCGSSPIVAYEGTGAYFLDRVAEGCWQLEVYPDCAFVDDPFGKQRIGRDVSIVLKRSRKMTIALPDLSETFGVDPLSTGEAGTVARAGAFNVRPGIYLLHRKSAERGSTPTAFVAPEETQRAVRVRHIPPRALQSDRPWLCEATVVADEEPSDVRLYLRESPFGKWKDLPLQFRHAASYVADVKPGTIQPRMFEYCIAVTTSKGVRTFPQDVPGTPISWDFPDKGCWHCTAAESSSPLPLMDSRVQEDLLFAGESWKAVSWGSWRTSAQVALRLTSASKAGDETCCQWSVTELAEQLCARDTAQKIVLEARSRGGECPLTILLLERDGSAWGTTVQTGSEWSEFTLPLSRFELQRAALIPRGYPYEVTPYWRPIPDNGRQTRDHVNIGALQFVQLALRQFGSSQVEIRRLDLT